MNSTSGFLQRKNHQIYWQEAGNPQGQPVLIIHGGPGGQINERWGNFFDKHLYRIIFFDQRGCGKSLPFGETADNTPALQVEDIEALRQHLGVNTWSLFGGSWGTTLALMYALRHPERCESFLLRGVWLARPEDIDWFVWGSAQVYPAEHERLANAIERAYGRRPHSAREMIIFANQVLQKTHGIEPKEQIQLAHEWFDYEMALSALTPLRRSPLENLSVEEVIQENNHSLSIAKLETHYLRYELPLKTALLHQIQNCPALTSKPCQIVHGKYDMVCPVSAAYALHKAWPGSELDIAPHSGHYTFEPEMEKLLYRSAAKLTL